MRGARDGGATARAPDAEAAARERHPTTSVAVISAFALSGAAGHAHEPGEEPAGTHDTHTHVVRTVPRGGGEATPSAPRDVRKPVQTGSLSPPSVAAHDDGDGHVH